ncbi:hypothetical protein [Iningainema tapete]|uniref:Uncharacterized protein n=1 Tax=Iningainema tapete BLCC-T55 TaxID=2748662 RepID=A0A8J7C5F2_9CYAN|nr:hypothetical protein [Iningainema tapete]MBD2773054.1 hypothetical protein [Iningainema tapete BLCC-T55]
MALKPQMEPRLGILLCPLLLRLVSWGLVFSSMCDLRITQSRNIESLATTIHYTATLNPLGWSW